MQAFEKQTGFLQPRRPGTNAATPRRKVFGLDGNGVTRGSEKSEGQPPVLVDADDGGRLRPDFEPRRKQAPTGSADADDGRGFRPDFGPRRKQALPVRLSGSFLREPHDAPASCPGGNDPTPTMALRTMIAGPSGPPERLRRSVAGTRKRTGDGPGGAASNRRRTSKAIRHLPPGNGSRQIERAKREREWGPGAIPGLICVLAPRDALEQIGLPQTNAARPELVEGPPFTFVQSHTSHEERERSFDKLSTSGSGMKACG